MSHVAGSGFSKGIEGRKLSKDKEARAVLHDCVGGIIHHLVGHMTQMYGERWKKKPRKI